MGGVAVKDRGDFQHGYQGTPFQISIGKPAVIEQWLYLQILQLEPYVGKLKDSHSCRLAGENIPCLEMAPVHPGNDENSGAAHCTPLYIVTLNTYCFLPWREIFV